MTELIAATALVGVATFEIVVLTVAILAAGALTVLALLMLTYQRTAEWGVDRSGEISCGN